MLNALRGAALITTAFLVACNGSPSTPSSNDARILGTVRMAASGAPASALNVSVSGTSLATTSRSDGQFTLNSVPAGTVTLTFEGSGVNARLPLDAVRAGDRVTIVVTVNGTNAKLDSRRDEADDEDDDDDNEVEGLISGLGGSCPARTFSIGNTSVTTSANTKYERVTCDTLANGLKVEVEGTRTGNVLDAKKIEKD